MNGRTASNASDGFEGFEQMIRAAGGLSLGQVCSIAGLESSTVQNWIKRGFVAHPVNKRYYEKHLARVLLIASLKDCLKIEQVGELMRMINGDADDESDDIVSEQALYDLFSRAVGEVSDKGYSPDLAQSAAFSAASSLEDANKKDIRHLTMALGVMIRAYTAGQIKKQAESEFEKLKAICKEDK